MLSKTPVTTAGRDPAGGAALRVVDGAIAAASIVVAVATTTGLFLVIGLDVAVRYLTRASMAWVSEVPNLLFPWMIMAGIVLAAQWGRHVLVELGVRLMPERAGRVLVALSQVPIALVFAYLAWTGIEVVEITATERFPVTRISTSWAYLAMPVGFSLLAVTALTTLIRVLTQRGDPFVVREGLGSQEGEL